MKKLFLLLIIASLFGCDIQYKKPDLTHQVIFLNNYYNDYIKAVKTDYLNKDKIYFSKVSDPIYNTYFTKSEYYDLVKKDLYFPIQDTAELEMINALILKNQTEIETIITRVLEQCNSKLPNDSLTFYIMPASHDLKPIITKMGGITGMTAGSKQIALTINPTINGWEKVLEYAIAHEYNHAYWTKTIYNSSYKWTLLNYLVFEGKADSFAHLLYPNVKAPWTVALSEKEKLELWNRIKPVLQSEDPLLLRDVMFGSEDYPIWGGYTLGYAIVQSALKNHPDLMNTNWTKTSADKILEMSDYK